MTSPSRIRFGILSNSLPDGLLAQHRLDAGDVAAHLARTSRGQQEAAGFLETQVESFLAQIAEFVLELVVGLRTNIAGLHVQPSMPTRPTKHRLSGSLSAANSSASRAT